MLVSGKRVVILMFAIAIALCWWVRIKAPKISVKNPIQSESGKVQKKVGYRTKMYPSMEQARGVAEKKLAQEFPQPMMIIKYESKGDGWLFQYETQKYLNSGHPKDQIQGASPIFVNKEGEAEFYSEKTKLH